MSKILKEIWLFPVKVYQVCISPMLGPAKCRYSTSCSRYFTEAVRRHGILRGSILGWARILRCSPFFWGGEDPVPEKFSWRAVKEPWIIYRKRREKKVRDKN